MVSSNRNSDIMSACSVNVTRFFFLSGFLHLDIEVCFSYPSYEELVCSQCGVICYCVSCMYLLMWKFQALFLFTIMTDTG